MFQGRTFDLRLPYFRLWSVRRRTGPSAIEQFCENPGRMQIIISDVGEPFLQEMACPLTREEIGSKYSLLRASSVRKIIHIAARS
jgi:hypothetical protein